MKIKTKLLLKAWQRVFQKAVRVLLYTHSMVHGPFFFFLIPSRASQSKDEGLSLPDMWKVQCQFFVDWTFRPTYTSRKHFKSVEKLNILLYQQGRSKI